MVIFRLEITVISTIDIKPFQKLKLHNFSNQISIERNLMVTFSLGITVIVTIDFDLFLSRNFSTSFSP